MVQLMNSGSLLPDPDTTCRDKVPVKMEFEDALEDEHGPLNKRLKPAFQEWSDGTNAFPVPPPQYNPLDEPSPLGLSLRKSPSLLDLIQMKLSQGSASSTGAAQSENFNSVGKKESKGTTASGPTGTDKLKASNFPASLLRIGCWEYKSRYEGDLVAKCYFAKHKLVWEVLEGGLKSKIEIQWSDIMALKAHCPDSGISTLNVVLARQPLFFRETNPQPRKHTLWQATADFTDGQASIHRQHFLQCPQGLLSKHFEKLIQCDMRLNFLSRQPEIVLDSPYFEQRASVFDDPTGSKDHGFGQAENVRGSSMSGLHEGASSSAQDSAGVTLDHHSREAPSPSSVMDSHAIEVNETSEVVDSKSSRHWEQIKVPGIHPSMSVSDLVNHIGHCISEQMTSSNSSLAEGGSQYHDILEDIAQYLLNDNQFTTASDEKSLMTRVNSLCCLLQKDTTSAVQTQNIQGESCFEGFDAGKNAKHNLALDSHGGNMMRTDFKATADDNRDNRQPPAMSRKDSFGELLLHLPRIASLPKFLFNITEDDGESQAK